MFWNHIAHLVSTNPGAFLGHHVTHLVGANLGPLLGYHAADRVRNFLLANFAFVTHAVDGLFPDFRHPHFATHLARRALAGNDPALARDITTATGARIPNPAPRLLHTGFDHRTRNFLDLSFPMTAANIDRFGVVDGLAN